MSHVARSLGRSAGILLLACAAVRAAASDYAELASNPVRGESAGAEVNPRYYNQGENTPRALDTGAPREFDASGPRPMPIRPLPIPAQHAERMTSGTDEAAPNAQAEPQDAVAGARVLPLAPPSKDERAGFRAGELPALVTGAASLGIVLGLFLLVVWVVCRGMPKNASLLPREAVEILGRAALVGRQQVHLVRCGNKILLLSVSPTCVETLTEITDPDEVERLAGICQQSHPRGATSFRQVFQQFGGQTRDSHHFADQDAEELDFAQLELSHHRGRELRAEMLDTLHTNRLRQKRTAAGMPRVALRAALLITLAMLTCLLCSHGALADEPSQGAAPLELPGGLGNPQSWTSPEGLSSALQVILLLTVVSLAPAILMMTTCFVRIVVVLGLLRQALGTQQLPPNQVMTSIALFMTLLIMSPVWNRVYTDAIAPYTAHDISLEDAWDAGVKPVRQFMSAQIDRTGNRNDVWLFYKYLPEGTPAPSSYDDVPLAVLLPAYMLSELKTAFLIGFQIYLPFLVLDIVVASVTISMGMLMLPPAMISLPFKLLLFVLVDGWHLVIGMLMDSFQTFS